VLPLGNTFALLRSSGFLKCLMANISTPNPFKNKIFGILEPIFSEGKETIFEPVMLLTAYLYHRYLEAVMVESKVKIVSTKK